MRLDRRMSFDSFLLRVVPCLIIALAIPAAFSADSIAYFGTYTKNKSKGIYAYRFHPATGNFTEIGLVAETPNPTWLTIHPNHRFLYAANEIGNYQGQKAGAITAYSLDSRTGKLTKLNQVSSRGDGPCHLAVDQTGKVLIVANYGGGSIASYPIMPDGSLGEAATFIQHTGTGGTPPHPSPPHGHSANLSPDNRFVLVDDLGLDEVKVYKIDLAKATLTPNDPPFARTAAGAGPRHLAFSPNGKFVYNINELNSTLTVFAYDKARGALKEVQTLSTLPAGFHGDNSTAEVAVHPNGGFVYGSNRGHNSIAVFSVESATGKLSLVEHAPTKGKTPRSFEITPDGGYMVVGNQDTDDAFVFKIDTATGKLTPTGQKLEIGSPVCIKFTPAG